MDAPHVSVIMPAYNRPRFLRPAIESVVSQGLPAWELLIVDDGSNDPETLAILAGLADPRIRVLRRPHCGLPGAVRNAGIAEARGEYLAFLDSDDLWPSDKLALQLGALRARPECGWSYGRIGNIDEHGAPIPTGEGQPWTPLESAMVERLLRMDARVATPTVMMRRDLACALGNFDEALVYAEDYDLWTRAALRSAVVAVDAVMALVRRHPRAFDGLAADRCWVAYYDKFARLAPDARLRRLARGRGAARALSLAHRLAGQPGKAQEARTLLLRHGPALLIQPRRWPSLARAIVRTVLNAGLG